MSLLRQEIPRQPNFSKLVFKIFPSAADDIKAGLCPMCQRELSLTPFRDALSEREFSISGMCQVCQDSIFGYDPELNDSFPCDNCSELKEENPSCDACSNFDHHNPV
jgi:hypothetical protein